jgi:hypothetical protein
MRFDTRSDEIQFRASSGNPARVAYSADSRVMQLGRVHLLSQLRLGDVVAMEMEKDAGGHPHVHVIRVQESASDWDQRNN